MAECSPLNANRAFGVAGVYHLEIRDFPITHDDGDVGDPSSRRLYPCPGFRVREIKAQEEIAIGIAIGRRELPALGRLRRQPRKVLAWARQIYFGAYHIAERIHLHLDSHPDGSLNGNSGSLRN